MTMWMLHTALVAGLIAAAALAVEEGLRLLGRPLRWGWMLAMTAAAVLPLLYQLLPPRPEPNGPAGAADPDLLAALLAQAPAVERSAGLLERVIFGWPADLLLTAAWLTAAVAMAAVLLLTYRRLAALRARARAVEIAGIPTLLTESSGPMVVGFRRPQVVVPRWIEALPEQEQRLVMQHEHEHVRAGDPRLLLGAALLLTAMPWNLPLWWMRRRLRQALEVDCDARVLAAGADRRAYGDILIRMAGRPRRVSLLAPALVELPSLLERRIIAMTAKSPRYRDARLGVALALAALLFAAACELTPRSTGPAPTEPTLAELLGEEVVVEEPAVVDSAAAASLDRALLIVRNQAGEQGEPAVSGNTLRADTIRVRVRPFLTGTGPANPLIIVDGSRASIASVAPDRILRVEVLKDAAATERFGEEGRDGVVLITTHKGAGIREFDPAPTVPAPGAPDGSVRVRAEAPVNLEGIVAVGYGTATRAEVAEISQDIARVRPSATVPAVVEGSVAVGYGTASRSEITASGDPLVIVDGEIVPTMTDVTARYGAEDIESITVLKDATAAVARYGVRAQHGAIIIELKK